MPCESFLPTGAANRRPTKASCTMQHEIARKKRIKKRLTHETAPEIHRPAGHPLTDGRIRLPDLLADEPLPHPTQPNGKEHPRSHAHERLQRNDCARQAAAERLVGTDRSDRLDRIRQRAGVYEDAYHPERQAGRQHPHLHLGTRRLRYRPYSTSRPASQYGFHPFRKEELDRRACLQLPARAARRHGPIERA